MLLFLCSVLFFIVPDRDNKDGWVDRNQDMANKWHNMSDDKRKVFTDPFFFALAGLPDYSKAMEEATHSDANDEEIDGVNVQYCDESTKAPQVHQLSDEDKQRYQPLFDKLVNIDKLHLCHGKPEPTASVATLQKRSLLAVQKAHLDVRFSLLAFISNIFSFSLVCLFSILVRSNLPTEPCFLLPHNGELWWCGGMGTDLL